MSVLPQPCPTVSLSFNHNVHHPQPQQDTTLALRRHITADPDTLPPDRKERHPVTYKA